MDVNGENADFVIIIQIVVWTEKLIRYVINDARAQDRTGIVLTCKESLIHYYEKFGFQKEGISESIHGGATWYQMRLTF